MTDTPPDRAAARAAAEERLRAAAMERLTAPMAFLTGEAGEQYALATVRWRHSGYDKRLAPVINPDEAQRALYDAYDRGEWPP